MASPGRAALLLAVAAVALLAAGCGGGRPSSDEVPVLEEIDAAVTDVLAGALPSVANVEVVSSKPPRTSPSCSR